MHAEYPPDLSTILKDFVVEIWDLKEADRKPWEPEGLLEFPKGLNIHSKIVFNKHSIKIESLALRDLEITVHEDRIEVPWMEPPVKVYAADQAIFETTLALIAHLMLACSMGWDTSDKVGKYTQKRVKELVNARKTQRFRNLSDLSKKKVQG